MDKYFLFDSRRIDQFVEVLVQSLRVLLSELLLLSEYSLHDVVLVLFLDESPLDAQSLVSIVFTDGV